MKILSIETSCDETAVSILECEGDESRAMFRILGNALLSQIDIHQEYGGVFPMVAKREHARNLTPLLMDALEEAEMLRESLQRIPQSIHEEITELLEREPGLSAAFFDALSEIEIPEIDAIAVTAGPGLEPALWVGVNFAKALSLLWNKPLIAGNHMEGHLLAALADANDDDTLFTIKDVQLPLLGLLISGGHTELIEARNWLTYEKIGQTRDDAVGEAYDKVARMLDLPYPGGPEIEKLAARNREDTGTNPYQLPRPMLNSGDLDFSFSGLKTAVLYKVKELPESHAELDKEQLAAAFEDAVMEVLWKKTADALTQTNARTLAIGGGVSASAPLRAMLRTKIAEKFPDVRLCIPTRFLSTDNAVMIGIAAYFHALRKEFANPDALIADGNLSIASA